ncbi:hypothetical protein ACCO45_003849 [Purpureocillium lilacinum]|uniref:Uncharacterized protein n=1 Tax=Purpureocillium lilacinum TaxID=33203 RepID=A0ACC4E119_PURLI
MLNTALGSARWRAELPCQHDEQMSRPDVQRSEAATATPDGISPPGRLSTKLRASASAPTLRSGSGDGATRVAPSQGKRKKAC